MIDELGDKLALLLITALQPVVGRAITLKMEQELLEIEGIIDRLQAQADKSRHIVGLAFC